MSPIRPGDETGIYYIVISNLPFKTTWQTLKDFARNRQPDGSCLSVEHAHIYPNSGNGWITVRGKTDFRKAFKHLNGGIFEGRALIADDRNETQVINIRDPLAIHSRSDSSMTGQYASSSFESSSSYTPSSPPTSDSPSEWSYSLSPPVQNNYTTTGYSSTLPIYDTRMHYLPPVPPAPLGMIYAGHACVTTPIYVPASSAGTYSLPFNHSTSASSLPPPPVSSPQSFDSNNTIQTEARKIVLTHVSTSASESAVRDLLRWAASDTSPATKLESLDYPRHQDGKPKGYALAVYDNHTTAKSVIENLDGMEWGSRTLSARFAKEGVEKEKSSKSKDTEKRAEREKEKGKKPRTGEKGNSKEAGPSSKEPKNSHHRREALVVDGTGGRKK